MNEIPRVREGFDARFERGKGKGTAYERFPERRRGFRVHVVGIDGGKIASDMNDYVLKNGRVITFTLGNRKGTLLTSKHENSISYDQSIRVASAYEPGCDVMFIVDAVSRKYFTSDVSWLWDIDFEMLNNDHIHQIILAGKYVNDLALRFQFSGIPQDKIKTFEEIEAAVDSMNNDRSEYIYAITCFSDKGKFLARKRPSARLFGFLIMLLSILVPAQSAIKR